MLKTLCVVALIASTLSIGPAFAISNSAAAPQPSTLTFTAMPMHMTRHLPWCSAHVRHHCRPHHMMMNKAM